MNAAFKCDKQDDCGDFSDEIDCPANCQFYMASSGDVVESPNYPHKYAPLSNCKWTLEGPQGHNILLQVLRGGRPLFATIVLIRFERNYTRFVLEFRLVLKED